MLVALLSACDAPPSPSTGEPRPVNLVVIVTTAGVDHDPDSYVLLIGANHQALQVGPTIRVDLRFESGTYDVRLDDLAPNCSVAGPNSVQVTLRESQLTSVTFAVECHALTGHIRIFTPTVGQDFPPMYRATLTPGAGMKFEQPVPANAAATIHNLQPDTYEVALSGLSPNCRLTGPPVQTTTVTAGGLDYAVASVDFAVVCMATTGDLRVITITTGMNPDQSGYSLWMDGQVVGDGYGDFLTLPPNGERLLRRLASGSHTLELRHVAANCSVEGANPRPVTITPGVVSAESFHINCVAP
jgi:hypothetical protein